MDEIPVELSQDKGIQHDIDLVPGTKYCVTRHWPLPRDQVKAIDDLFDSRRQVGQVRESKSSRNAPAFCVKKPQGRWRIVHAYNKLNDATIPAQTTIPRKDVIIDSMAKSTIYSALDLHDGVYQILTRESDVALTAVSTPSGMLWEWLATPQGLKNAPATFNRCVTHLLRSVRDFPPSYFDDVFVQRRAVNGKTDVEMHKEHLRKLLGLMRKHNLYANLKKCIFGASEIPILGCLVGKNGVRPDPEKVRVISEWPTLSNVKELRQFLGLATYLCKYVENYAGKIRPLSQLLKKEAEWKWTAECQQAFDAVKQGLTEAPILAVADQDRPFHVVCDASEFAIGCALMQHDHDPRDRVVYYQSRQLKPAERNYPVHDTELLVMKYALAKFRVYLLGRGPFEVYTDHASLRIAMKSPHISQRMARWLSFFAEYCNGPTLCSLLRLTRWRTCTRKRSLLRLRFGGEVAPNLEAISDALGIHGARSVGTEGGEEGVTGVGAFSFSSLRERFELEALGSSSRGRRDPVTGSCATAADSESAAEDETSPSSMWTSLMSDP
ncbi:hypothetical protein PC116_g27790 [Phytophthora cactorum]|uniref:Reverse transcriptase domain-containing protein n=1 Tax=Phytophthora cactorum TaxID=29920 RepID=A0A8T1JGM3_9STRA|nr:hypothetical protein Pcac1_g19643 [Phytophthora cactorum]KAG2791765.1 hypothetical protein PC111_g23769 [Phytophthora cactorum]KAG2793388.1 hypothetical protein PC112_g23466 [Phytophthora cactorum]KAG2814622.1 hypothetical protein PC113_g23296 [Phytophthora cactorum]KAG2872851.1 hypothetical protein PC114_g26160 [Phytophthora cactorum]